MEKKNDEYEAKEALHRKEWEEKQAAKKAAEQAEKYGHSLEREYAFLIAHSMLHLLGYDHMEPEEAERMEQKQEAVLNSMGIPR